MPADAIRVCLIEDVEHSEIRLRIVKLVRFEEDGVTADRIDDPSPQDVERLIHIPGSKKLWKWMQSHLLA
jgi:hypothetical protein